MKFHPLRTRKSLVVLMVLLLSIMATPARANSEAIVIVVPQGTIGGCAINQIIFPLVFVYPSRGPLYYYHVLVSVDGTVYMDHLIIIETTAIPPIFEGELALSSINTGTTATGSWPLPSGQPISVVVRLEDENRNPVWENRMSITQCNGGSLFEYSTGGVSQIVQNAGFEQGGAKASIPAKWKSNVDNDKRVCNTDTKTVAHNGECAYQFMGKAGVSSNISQTYVLEGIGKPGDQMRLAAWVSATNVSAGGKIRATVKFPTLPQATLNINVAPGTYEYTRVESNAVDLSEAPNKVIIKAQMVNGGGKFLMDDIAMLTHSNAGAPAALGLVSLPAVPFNALGDGKSPNVQP